MKTSLRKIIVIGVAACAVIGGAGVVLLYNEHQIYFRSFPHAYESEAAFFQLMQWPQPPDSMFNPTEAPHWDIGKIEKFIPPEGIEFFDVNGHTMGKASRKEILQNLKARNGKWFAAFAHLSHIYSIPYKQYSELSFSTDQKEQVLVNIASWYTLTFRKNGEQPVIVRWEYKQIEGD